MKLFEKIIDSIEIKLGRAYLVEVQYPYVFSGTIPDRNVLMQLNNGEMADGKGTKCKPGCFYFIPQGFNFKLKVGKGTNVPDLEDQLLTNEAVRSKYLKELSSLQYNVTKKDI